MLRPARPARSLRQYADMQCWAAKRNWPCLACRGQGWYYDPTDRPCPVEGYRLVRQLTYGCCKGTGEGTKAAVVEAYRKALENYRQRKAEYERLVYLRQKALDKPTKEETRALRELGL